jgi:hypothetical protein
LLGIAATPVYWRGADAKQLPTPYSLLATPLV